MQTEKLNTTTETVAAGNQNFSVTTFEAMMRVMCDICGNQSTGTKANLVQRGCGFAQGAEFCPESNF